MKQCICIWKKQECFSDIQNHNHHLLNIWQVQLSIIIRSSWIADALLKWSYACHSAVKPCSSNALTVIYLIWFDHCIEKRHIARTEQILPQPRAYRSTHAPKVHLPTSARAAALLWKSKVLFFCHGYAFSTLCIGVVSEDEGTIACCAQRGCANFTAIIPSIIIGLISQK